MHLTERVRTADRLTDKFLSSHQMVPYLQSPEAADLRQQPLVQRSPMGTALKLLGEGKIQPRSAPGGHLPAAGALPP